VQPGDIIAHPLGPTFAELTSFFPQAIHVETGIGYKSGPFGAYRIFESESWRHWHFGRYLLDDCNSEQARHSWVCPNYYDLEDWPIGKGKGGYFAFMARKCNAKGLGVLAEIIKAYKGPHPCRSAGQGEEWSDWGEFVRAVCDMPSRWENVGELRGRERAKFLGDAVALLCPTQFVEPFGGAAIEAMLCGTPAIGSAWGAYTETLPEWARCRTLEDWLDAMNHPELEAGYCAAEAYELYGLAAVGPRYVQIFDQIRQTHTLAT
jgi:glycosyltransferase involved in cell wall biosynthesis